MEQVVFVMGEQLVGRQRIHLLLGSCIAGPVPLISGLLKSVGDGTLAVAGAAIERHPLLPLLRA